TYHASDGVASSSIATVTLTVAAPSRYALSGTVTANGSALPGARLSVYTGTGSLALITSVFTDANGAYSLDLPAGSYRLYLRPNEPGFADQWYDAPGLTSTTAKVVELNAATVINFSLSSRYA